MSDGALADARASVEEVRARARALAALGSSAAAVEGAQALDHAAVRAAAVGELEALCRQLLGALRATAEAARAADPRPLPVPSLLPVPLPRRMPAAAATVATAATAATAPTSATAATAATASPAAPVIGATRRTRGGAAQRGLAGAVLRGAGLTSAGYLLTQLLSLATYLALARLLLPRQLGVYEAAGVAIGVGLIVGESGLLAALVTRRDRLQEACNSAFLATLAGGLGLSALAAAVAPLVGIVFRRSEVALVAAVMAGTVLPRLLVIVPNALLQRRLAFLRRVVVDPLGALAFGATAVGAAAAGWGVWALVLGTYAQVLVNLACAWLLSGFRPHPRLASVRTWRELSRFGRPVLAGELLRRGRYEIPTVGLGRFVGPAALGQFSYAFRIAAQPVAATIDVGGYVLLSALAQIAAEPRRLAAAAKRSLRWICALSFPLGMALVGLGHPLVVLLFGARWAPAGAGAMALGAWAAASSISTFAGEAFKASRRPELIARMQLIALGVTVVGVGALLPFGVVGVCAGLALGAAALAMLATRWSAGALGLPVRALSLEIMPPAAAAALMGLALLALDRMLVHAAAHGVLLGLVLVAAESVIGAAIYAGALLALSPAVRAEAGALLWGTRWQG